MRFSATGAGLPARRGLLTYKTNKTMSEATKTIDINEFRKHEGDTGSADVQIARLTGRILHLTEHMQTNRKDFSSRRGLLKLVSTRRKLLDYVKREDEGRYKEIITKLGLRR